MVGLHTPTDGLLTFTSGSTKFVVLMYTSGSSKKIKGYNDWFLKISTYFTKLSGSAKIGTLQTGSSIVGISIVGNPYTKIMTFQ